MKEDKVKDLKNLGSKKQVYDTGPDKVAGPSAEGTTSVPDCTHISSLIVLSIAPPIVRIRYWGQDTLPAKDDDC